MRFEDGYRLDLSAMGYLPGVTSVSVSGGMVDDMLLEREEDDGLAEYYAEYPGEYSYLDDLDGTAGLYTFTVTGGPIGTHDL